MSSTCPSCCPACTEKNLHFLSRKSAIDPYALEFLLPVGTLTIGFDSMAPDVVCGHAHADDGWHPFDSTLFAEYFNADDNTLWLGIKFLTKHHFISTTYRLKSPTTAFLRIYIIPYDLGNVQGKLRVRKEAILAPARRYLKSLLPRITQNPESWQGQDYLQSGPSLISDKKVCCSISCKMTYVECIY